MGGRPVKLLMDTHAWVWWCVGSDRLTAHARKAIRMASEGSRLYLSAISVWEVGKLVAKHRLRLDRDVEGWVAEALSLPGLQLVPLSPEIACKSCALPPPFHDDPGDQIIVATARALGATILTADERIQRYPHCVTMW
jgi:PIN domain nuclease of toxin-antitoxin system